MSTKVKSTLRPVLPRMALFPRATVAAFLLIATAHTACAAHAVTGWAGDRGWGLLVLCLGGCWCPVMTFLLGAPFIISDSNESIL